MALSNHERVGKALELLRDGLRSFVEREMRSRYGEVWSRRVSEILSGGVGLQAAAGGPHLDVHGLLTVMWEEWNEVFKQVLGRAERSLVSELRDVRNRWAHQEAFSTDDAYRALDSMVRLLTAISAPEARLIDAMKQELLRIRYEQQARRESRRASGVPTEGRPAQGLRSWREVVTPHPDVASGRYQQAEFAADLGQVHRGEGSSEYRDPREFFSRTFITDGLRRLLTNAVRRLSGAGGDPVVELQTNFGGGKTHSMLALYHLFSEVPVSDLPGVEDVLTEAGIKRPSYVRRAVLVGTALSPAQPLRILSGGRAIHTLWGELAWQIGGEEGFDLVAAADSAGVSPGSEALRTLFGRFGPCLVLIDEWVAFVRQLYRDSTLPAGSFEANMTFAQALTEAAKQVPNALVVASLPASDIEIGGEGGREALVRIRNIFGRVESPWRPASAEEGFEIVRRRLFQPISDPEKYAARDAVIAAFGRMYHENPQEFPSPCKEADYERRMKSAYPIHPELFDQLYGAWSSLDKFQRTRGVLRLLASVIHALWERNDASLLIMPGTIPVDDPAVQQELTRYLDDNWAPVIEKDVDGPHSLPLALDRDNPNLGRYSACRRVARTIYMGSAPTSSGPNPGVDDRSIKLGCVQPGETAAVFGDALRRLTDKGTHLYVDGSRYWFSIQPSVTRLAQDRAEQLDIADVWEELKKRLRADKTRGDFAGIHAAPEDSAEVADEMRARLVVLGPEHPHAPKAENSLARNEARALLEKRGTADRRYRNMLLFLAPDRARLSDLEQAIREYLAWDSIVREASGALNLTPFQTAQAKTQRDKADGTVGVRINETYVWLLVPAQDDPRGEIEWRELRLTSENEPPAVRVSKKVRGEYLITKYSAASLRIDLDRYVWQNVPHVRLKTLWEYMASYPYLPRLKDEQVLIEAVQDGIAQITWSDNFAYAEAFDETKQRYLGVKFGQRGSVILDDRSLIVKPEVVLAQIPKESGGATEGGELPARPGRGTEKSSQAVPGTSAEPRVRRFHGTVNLDPLRLTRDISVIAEEVVQHFTSLVGAQVEVTLEITVKSEDEIPERVVRVVSENCRTLKFKNNEFEKE